MHVHTVHYLFYQGFEEHTGCSIKKYSLEAQKWATCISRSNFMLSKTLFCMKYRQFCVNCISIRNLDSKHPKNGNTIAACPKAIKNTRHLKKYIFVSALNYFTCRFASNLIRVL